MSYDVYLGCHSCGQDLIRGGNNMTSNLARMWSAAGAPLDEWSGRLAAEVLPKLQSAIDELTNNPHQFVEMQPENGWGTHQDCLGFLQRIRDAACRDPSATLSVCH